MAYLGAGRANRLACLLFDQQRLLKGKEKGKTLCKKKLTPWSLQGALGVGDRQWL